MSRHALLLSGLIAIVACERGGPPANDVRYDTIGGIPHVINGPLAGWDSARAWRLEEDLRIGEREASGATAFARIADIALDEAGRIHVLEQRPAEVRVFGVSGEHLRTIGGAGEGPGEMRRPVSLAIGLDGSIWVSDATRRVLIGYDSAGTVLLEARRPVDQSTTDGLTIDAQGRVVEAVSFVALDAAALDAGRVTYTAMLVRLDPHEPERADTIRLPGFDWPAENGGRRAIAPTDGEERRWFILPGIFAKAPQSALDARGFVWYAPGEPYTIHRIALNGDTLATILREVEPEPVPPAYRDSLLEVWNRMGSPGPALVGETRPFFAMATPFETIRSASLIVSSSGRLWARRFGDGSTGAGGDARFDVFDPDGRYLGEVVAPYPLELTPVPVVTRSAVYGVTRDELDVPYVVRLRIVRPGG